MRRPRTTATGRIVYDRPIHFFSAKDLSRIARSIPIPDNLMDALMLFRVAAELYARYSLGLFRIVASATDAFSILTEFLKITMTLCTEALGFQLSEDVRKKLWKIIDLIASI